MRLLAKSPADRVGSAAEIAATLGSLGAKDWDDAPPRAIDGTFHRPQFVGRDHWLTELDARLHACANGGGTSFFIGGERGAGKTRLLAETATNARKIGFHVLTSQELATWTAARAASHAPQPHPLRTLLRELEQHCAGYSKKAGRTSRLSVAAPLLVVLDDLHAADDLTLALLQARLLPLCQRMRLFVLGAFRSDERGTSLQSMLATCGHDHRTLERLDDNAIRSVIRDTVAIPIADPLAARVARHSRGNPFWAGEYLRAAIADAIALAR
jgi:predicted ATPase